MLGAQHQRFVTEAGWGTPSLAIRYVTLLTSVLACLSCGKVTIGVETTLPVAADPSVVRPSAKQRLLLELTELMERLESRHGVRLLDRQGRPLVLATLEKAQIAALKSAVEAILRAPEGSQEAGEALRALEADAKAFGAVAVRVSKVKKMEGEIAPPPPTPDFAAGGFSCEAAPILGRAGEARVFPCALSRPEAAPGVVFRWAGARPAACPDLVVSGGLVGAVLGSGPACTGSIEACDAAGLCVASTNPVTIAGAAIATSIGTPTLTPQCRVEFPATRSISGPIVGATGLQTFSGVDLAPHATASGYSLPVSNATAPGDFRIDFGFSGSTFEGRPISDWGLSTLATRDVRLLQSVALLPLRQATSTESASMGGIAGNVARVELPNDACVTCGHEGTAQIAAGRTSVCLKTSLGEVYCWGDNGHGQLGDGSTLESPLPRKVTLPGPARRVTLESSRVCAVLQSDELWCWGYNADGFLDGGATSTHVLIPKKVTALGSQVATASAGTHHLCAVLLDGTLKCWGRGDDGRLGLGDEVGRPVPTSVPFFDAQGAPVPVSDVSAGSDVDGGSHTCALTRAGAAWCWGANWGGALGDGTDEDRHSPVPVAGFGSGVVQLSTASYYDSCGLKADGKAYCWGDSLPWSRKVPTEVPGVSNAVSITGGKASCDGSSCFPHFCALESSGDVKCWGPDNFGMFPTDSSADPAVGTKLPFPEPMRAVSAGAGFTCAIGHSGRVYCVGKNVDGIRGDGRSELRIPPTTVHADREFDRMFALHDFSCGAKGTTLWCWGSARDGRLGTATLQPTFDPVSLGDFASPVTDVVSARTHACALTQDGKVRCWGSNISGRLGRGTNSNFPLDPLEVLSLPPATSLAAGSAHTCAISGGKVFCWGRNNRGQLGKGDIVDALSPVEITSLGSDVAAIAASEESTCVLLSGTSSVRCWGSRTGGHVGVGAPSGNQTTPTTPTGLGSGVSMLHGNGDAFCAVRSGAVLCWGKNDSLQAGSAAGNTVDEPTPVVIPGASPVFIPSARGGTTCVVSTGADASLMRSCWGRSVLTASGILHATMPVQSALSSFTSLSLGSTHACGLEGTTWKCWGSQLETLYWFADELFPTIRPLPPTHVPVPVADPTVPSSALKAFVEGCVRWALSLVP